MRVETQVFAGRSSFVTLRMFSLSTENTVATGFLDQLFQPFFVEVLHDFAYILGMLSGRDQ